VKVALTGSAGLFGRHCRALFQVEGVDYVPLSRREWDLRDWASPEWFASMMQGADCIIHAAACLPGEADLECLLDVNLRAVVNLAEWSRDNGVHLVFISSGSVYADPHAPDIGETAVLGSGPLGGLYASTKRLAEAALEEFAATGLKVTVLRPSSVYGAGMKADQLLARLIALADSGGPVSINGARNQIDFLHAHDLCRAALAALRNEALGTYNIASVAPASLEEVAQTIAGICGIPLKIEPVDQDPPPFIRFALDTSAARAAFDYQPVVKLRDGLEMTRSQKFLSPLSALNISQPMSDGQEN